MHTITLTQSERSAIDWVGYRYRHGDELYKLLWGGCTAIPDDANWNSPCDITFRVPEHVAWEIQSIVEDGLDCFSREFCSKLHRFCDAIV